jgi:outer membrane receptor protein involved in Fe transport
MEKNVYSIYNQSKTIHMKAIFTILSLCFCVLAYSQTTITGTVVDESQEPILGANVIVIGTDSGTATDYDGNFSLTVSQSPPFSIEISIIGYKSVIEEVTSNNQSFSIVLIEGDELDEVVVSASRTPESVRESPVTIERFDTQDIKFSTSPNFYTSLENLKGVDINKGSLTFNAINTRGFATFANTRFVQLVDGMDNASPVLNFPVGNFLGMNELDIESIEILPGASSALYGANAFNGILFMTSKNPFDDQGISTYFRTGLTSQEAAGDHKFYDFGMRAAYKFSDKLAAKASFSYLYGTDWYATDTNEYVLGSPGEADEILPFKSSNSHDAMHIYGDEVATNINDVAQTLEAAGLIPPGSSMFVPSEMVGRTGYFEQDLTDYKAKNGKFDAAVHYRPSGNDFEIIWNSRFGFGNTIYQGANRYQLKNFIMQQHKLEISNDDFFLRGYTTNEAAGDSYDMRFTGINMNKVNADKWFGTYVGAYLQGILGGATSDEAHALARIFADDAYTPQPGTDAFNRLFNNVTSDPDISTGSKFQDNTGMLVGEGNYNFKRLLNDMMDLQVGGSYRQYSLDSKGTIMTDYDGPIKYNEYGGYIQAIKRFADDRLKVTASIRVDKNEFFDESYSPRVSLVYSAGENKDHNFRASFQTGFRNPDTQSLFIGFDVGRAILVGAAPDNLDRRLPNTDLTGRDAYFDSYTLASVLTFAQTENPADLVPVVTPLVEQEKVTAFDVGYRGKIGPVNVDLNGYYNIYEGFIANKYVVTPIDGSAFDPLGSGVMDVATGNTQVFQLYSNSLADVKSYGAVVGLSTKFAGDYRIGVNYTYAKFDMDSADDPDFRAGFNTPENQIKVSFGNPNLLENFGFNVDYRYRGEYLWESSIANALMPSINVFDAQLNYSVPSIKSVFKIGGTNLGGDEYQSAVATGFIGSQYFISWTINQ